MDFEVQRIMMEGDFENEYHNHFKESINEHFKHKMLQH